MLFIILVLLTLHIYNYPQIFSQLGLFQWRKKKKTICANVWSETFAQCVRSRLQKEWVAGNSKMALFVPWIATLSGTKQY